MPVTMAMPPGCDVRCRSSLLSRSGKRPRVVCLHSNASTRGNGAVDGPSRAKIPRACSDSYDCGKSPQWLSDRVIHLRTRLS